MDAHVFRRFCHALSPLLLGARLEKIQSPAENVFALTFYAQQQKRHLVLKAGRKNPFIYFAPERPVANAPPSAMVMRWRKYCSGRRIAFCTYHWTERKIFLLFRGASAEHLSATAQPPPPQTWLIIDLREGPQLILGKNPLHAEHLQENLILSDIPTQDPTLAIWPNPQDLTDACEHWRQWPILTPALRRTLPHLDPLDQEALIVDLEMGGGDIFVYGEGESAELSAWPLVPELAKNRIERIFEDPFAASSAVGDALVLGTAASKKRADAALPQKREAARLEKLLTKLHHEETRLNAMVACQHKAILLQGMLWNIAAETKVASINTEDASMPEIELDPRLTVRENMQAFFHTAARGKRGLIFLQERREKLHMHWQAVQDTATALTAGGSFIQATTKGKSQPLQNKETVGKEHLGKLQLPKGVQAFKSSDGFLILRGKDSKGNWAALRASTGQDLWLHVEGGPGSHCIIRRQFSGQEIPQRTLLEAASLAAVKSWQKDNQTAHILCAQAKHVKPMRNAATGTVRIDKALETFRIDIIADIEEKLQL